MSQPKKKLSLKPNLTKIDPITAQWVEGGDPKQKSVDTETKKEVKRITLDVTPELHYKLKKHPLEPGEPMAELLRRLAEDYLAR